MHMHYSTVIIEFLINAMVENKENRAIYVFKLGHTAAEATRNINAAFGEGTVRSKVDSPSDWQKTRIWSFNSRLTFKEVGKSQGVG